MNVTGTKWQEGSQISVANGSFARILSQPMPYSAPKIGVETAYINVQQSPSPSFAPASQLTEQQSASANFGNQSAALSMQSDVASTLTGAISHGVGYDAKTGQAIGGSPQYAGTRYGVAIEAPDDKDKNDSIYNFSFGVVAALHVNKSGADMSGGMQEHGRNPSSKSRYFDWRTFYNARLFSRIMQKASDADHRAGLMKMRFVSLNPNEHESASNIALREFLKALNDKQQQINLVSYARQSGFGVAIRNSDRSSHMETVGESFWDVYGADQKPSVNLR